MARVALALSQPLADVLDAACEVVAVGVKGEVEQFGGLFLGRGRLDVGVPEGAVELHLFRGRREAGDGLAEQSLKRRAWRVASGSVGDEACSGQRVPRQRVRSP